MSDSLNSGNELDNELPTDTAQLVAEVDELDVSAEMQTIATLESRLDDLTYLAEDIRKSHGMSQSFAMEAQRLLPGFNANAPLGFYTKAPTATQLKVSLEEISNGIKALMVALAAAVLTMIWKFVAWLSGKKSDGKEGKASDTREALEKAEKKTEEYNKAGEAAGELSKVVRDIESARPEVVDRKGEKRHFSDFETLLTAMLDGDKMGEEKRRLFISRCSGFAEDITSNGPYKRIVSDLQRNFSGYMIATSRRMMVIKQIIENELEDPFDRRLAIQTDVMLDGAKKEARPNIGGSLCTISEAVDKVSEAREHVEKTVARRKTDISTLLDALSDLLISVISDQHTRSDSIIKELNFLEKAMVSLKEQQPVAFEESGRNQLERQREINLQRLCHETLLDLRMLMALHKEMDYYCKIAVETLKYCGAMIEKAASNVISSAKEHAIEMDPGTKRLFEMARLVAAMKKENGSEEIYEKLLSRSR